MGVRALQTYLEQYCQTAIPIQSIQELAEKYGSSTDRELIIIVDGFNIVQNVYFLLGYLPSIGGCQFKQYSCLIKLFVQAFHKIGIRLVFFFDGTTVAKKRKTWVERRMAHMESFFKFLDMLKEGTVPSDATPFVTSPGIFRQTKFILEEICKCQVFQSVFDCDEEIAEYSRRKGALGVLGHDSDFVIFDIGRAFYFDSDHLDLDKMETRVYYPEVLAQSLGLRKSQLPLLATLMGNDCVHYYELKRFHNKLCPGKGRDAKYLVPEIAKYIKSLDVHDPKFYRRVAGDVFGSSFRAGDIERSVLSYSRSFELFKDENCQFSDNKESGMCATMGRSYNGQSSRERCTWQENSGGSGGNWRLSGNTTSEEKGKWAQVSLTNWRERPRENWREENKKDVVDEEWLQVVGEAQERFHTNKMPDAIYGVMKHQLYESCSAMEDFRIVPRDLPIFAELTLELRQRLYGILLHQKPVKRDSHLVEEWCNAGPGSLERPSYILAATPSVHHPGLLALWGDEDRPKGRLCDIRWTLFVHSVSPSLDVHMVRQLPPLLVIPTLVLHYIVNYKGPGRLENWEVEVFLATAAVVHHYTAKDLHLLPDDLTYRGVRVSNIIMLATTVFDELLAACGYPLTKRQTAPGAFFDGKLFQFKYREIKGSSLTHAQLCDNKDDSLKAFQKARCVIFGKPEDDKGSVSG